MILYFLEGNICVSFLNMKNKLCVLWLSYYCDDVILVVMSYAMKQIENVSFATLKCELTMMIFGM